MLSVTHLPRVACVALSDKSGLLFNLLHANISMHILHTVPYTFLKVLIRRIFFNNQGLNSQVDDHFLYSHGVNQ